MNLKVLYFNDLQINLNKKTLINQQLIYDNNR